LEEKIKILPDNIANQIAAGEVLQRPANAVKELMENAIDASADFVEVIVKEGGTTFIQVHDNGSGMSETDARRCFERHATSKISKSEDLFDIHTKGFRGEALASIAAVGRVTLVTRRKEDPNGTCVQAEDSKVISQEPTAAEPGTSFTIKMLFYNVPARKKFLKSPKQELRHLQEEFLRIALAHPEIGFTLYDDRKLLYKFEAGSLKQRLAGVYGQGILSRLIHVTEESPLINIDGFILKPEFAKKNRGEQYFFVNKRFIKSPYFHHAIAKATEELLPPDTFPGYFIFLSVDPARLDVNIHPTKTEVKFEDEQMLYTILRASVRRALGTYHLNAELNFETETAFPLPTNQISNIHSGAISPPKIGSNPNFNPFKQEQVNFTDFKTELKESDFRKHPQQPNNQPVLIAPSSAVEPFKFIQFKNKYIVTELNNELVIVDQRRAHERILFEKFEERLQHQAGNSQLLMFPEIVEFNPSDMHAVEEMIPVLQKMGFHLELIGMNGVSVFGLPPEASDHPPKVLLLKLLEEYIHAPTTLRKERDAYLSKLLATKLALRSGIVFDTREAESLMHDLMKCKMPYVSISGKPIFYSISEAMAAHWLDKKLKN
jgi:DNA mismatch repair protein MutL